MYEDRTYQALLAEGKAQISDNILKSEGSLVHNALSALAYELEKFYIQADYLLEQLDPATADYDNLVKLCAQRGIYPKSATYAEAKLVGDVEIPIGARFNMGAYNYIIIGKISKYKCLARCETSGSAPNELTGVVTPITYVQDLSEAKITEILVKGTDASTKEDLLTEYKSSFDSSSFGGNVAEYKQKLNAVEGVGGCKIYPVWKDGGTVKAVLISSDYGKVSEYLIKDIQEKMCPTPKAGYGIAAIGHDMTVESVKELVVNVKSKITFATGSAWDNCKNEIIAAVSGYIADQRKSWANGDENTYITIYISRIESAILTCSGVLDIGDTTINGNTSNLALSWDTIPAMGAVEVAK